MKEMRSPALARLFGGAAMLLVGACSQRHDAVTTIAAAELQQRLHGGSAMVLDVRTLEEFSAGHVPGAWNIPVDAVKTHVEEIRTRVGDGDVVVYCRSGRRASAAATTLRGHGLTQLLHLAGDFPAWADAGLPVEYGTPGP
jgi:rhodanese-related sulfurtransferase